MKRILPLILAVAGAANFATAQMSVVPTTSVPEPAATDLNSKGWGIIHFVSNLGSFKCIDGYGRLEFEFKGTVLIANLEGTATPTGTIREEYSADKRKVYTGAGRLVVEGKWRGVQWFGSNMRGVWWGKGAIRFVGEFDKNLQTGDYWFEKLDEKQSWPAVGTITMFLPRVNYTSDENVVPKEKKKGG